MKPLIIIPARGGSKGVPKKNIKLLGGKPLIWHTIKAARMLFSDDIICVSTDSEEIKHCVEKTGLLVPFLRPAELATDHVGTREVILHALSFFEKNKNYHADTVILLQPTSPFRTAKHIEKALKLYNENTEMVVSVKETSSNPYFVLFEENEDGWLIKSKQGNFKRRQDCPKVWEYNGAIYIIKVNQIKKQALSEIKKIKKYLMGEYASHDIDTEFDWKIAVLINNNLSCNNFE